MAEKFTCCGQPMEYASVFGLVRVYRCVHRARHPLVFESVATGACALEGELLWRV